MPKPARLVAVRTVDLPVVEASGVVALAERDGTRVGVVGDRTTEVATTTYTDGQLGTWQAVDLADLDGWPDLGASSQFEAIALDGAGSVALLREDPPEVLVADTSSRRLVARVRLAAPPWSALAGKWDDRSSRGEGMVLLRGGRLLVAKERKPRALVEFGPSGSRAQGLSRTDFLDPGEPWAAPDGEARYHALAVWKLRDAAKKALGDISSLAVGPDRSLWMLSDKSACLARLSMDHPLPRAGGEIRHVDEIYRLPADVAQPEGIAALDTNLVLLAMDTAEPRDNGLLLTRPDTDAA